MESIFNVSLFFGPEEFEDAYPLARALNELPSTSILPFVVEEIPYLSFVRIEDDFIGRLSFPVSWNSKALAWLGIRLATKSRIPCCDRTEATKVVHIHVHSPNSLISTGHDTELGGWKDPERYQARAAWLHT
jgi:hypothetical protein